MSLTVLLLFLINIAIFGIPARKPDEGLGAHLFQLWLLLEILMMAFFTIKWLQKMPKQTIIVLIIQILSVLTACAPVFFLNL